MDCAKATDSVCGAALIGKEVVVVDWVVETKCNAECTSELYAGLGNVTAESNSDSAIEIE